MRRGEADRQRIHRRREERDAHAGVRRAKGHWSRFAAVRRFTSERVSGVRELGEVVGEVKRGCMTFAGFYQCQCRNGSRCSMRICLNVY